MPRVSSLLALLCIPLLVGCEGCRNNSDQTNESGQPTVPLQDFTARDTFAFPADSNRNACGIKPGHWMTASQSLKSNKIDLRGELLSQSSVRQFSLDPTENFAREETGLKGIRPVVLPKGQLRRFDFRLLPPVPASNEERIVSINSRFVSSGRGTFFDTGKQPFNIMRSQEYFLVVLTTRRQRFARMQVANCIRPFQDPNVLETRAAHYRMVFPPTKDVLPIPETMLDLTSTAVVLWDDLDGNALTPQQQTALADWIRFGGQLIVNGAAASDAISKTKLADVLPLLPTGNIELDPTNVADLIRGCSVAKDPTSEKQIALAEEQSRISIDGALQGDATTVDNTGNLVLTRRIGRGRVVQPRFDLTSDWMQSWESHDSFLNSVILLRPAREFVEATDPNQLSLFDQQYVKYPKIKHPYLQSAATINTRLRLASRDAVLKTTVDGKEVERQVSSPIEPLTNIDSVTGVAGWKDDSDTVSLCRGILRDESGIEIPQSSLVMKSLGWYLLILVPINYLIFRIMGRLEFAWLAVPVIAIGGAMWVARAARLDIGFARSQTELAVLELQPDYSRGHLTRVVAIYNSLSSTYDVEFDTIDGVASPINSFQEAVAADDTVFKTSFAEGPALAGLAVGSNQVKMLHSEQVIDIGGGFRLQGEQLINNSQQELLDTYVVAKNASGVVRTAMVGVCSPGTTVPLRFRTMNPAITDELPMQTGILVRRLFSPAAMPAGSTRLVGRIDDRLPGMTISPRANQASTQTIVLAHLKHPAAPPPVPDANLLSQFEKAQRLSFDDQDDSGNSNPYQRN